MIKLFILSFGYFIIIIIIYSFILLFFHNFMPYFCTLRFFKLLSQQGLSKPEFYDDLVYKLRKIVSRADFSDQFRKVIMR